MTVVRTDLTNDPTRRITLALLCKVSGDAADPLLPTVKVYQNIPAILFLFR